MGKKVETTKVLRRKNVHPLVLRHPATTKLQARDIYFGNRWHSLHDFMCCIFCGLCKFYESCFIFFYIFQLSRPASFHNVKSWWVNFCVCTNKSLSTKLYGANRKVLVSCSWRVRTSTFVAILFSLDDIRWNLKNFSIAFFLHISICAWCEEESTLTKWSLTWIVLTKIL